MPETLYELIDIARILGVGSSALSNWKARKTGPTLPEPRYITRSGKPLFTREQLEDFIADREAHMRSVIGE